jgi:hypothetical protein
MIVWCRVRGPRGRTRELSTVLDFNSAYCLMLRQDAIDVGYPEASHSHGTWRTARSDRAPLIVGLRGIERTILVTLVEVSIGELAARGVDAIVLEYDQSPSLPFDMIPRWTLLRNFRLEVDPASGYLSLSQHSAPR